MAEKISPLEAFVWGFAGGYVGATVVRKLIDYYTKPKDNDYKPK